MKLINLKLRNFKGIKEFELVPGGESQAIFGDNGTGKTTLFDAFSWLLFDKDSANRKDFEIKTLDPDGQAIHGLEHEVGATLEVSRGALLGSLLLKKVYSENWSKKRGSVDREFTGHTTNYFLDGVPAKKNEYEARIASIVNEDVFKLLTNPRHFNEVLHWQYRRQLLLEVCGDLSDADVIAADSKLAKLPDILNGRKLEDHRKVIAARRSEINNVIETIPVRISEVERGLPNILDDPSLNVEMEALRESRNAKAQELANLEAGGGVAEKTKELSLIEADIAKAERKQWTTTADEVQAQKVELRKLDDERARIDDVMVMWKERIEDRQASIPQYEVKLSALRQDWSMANSKNLTFEQSDTCPACGQTLPAEQLEAARENATADFNTMKANKLASISDEGHTIKAIIKALNDEIGNLELESGIAEPRLVTLNEEIGNAQAAIAALENKEKETSSDPAYLELTQKRDNIELDIEALRADHGGAIVGMKLTLGALDEKITACESTIARSKQRKTGLQRIEELKAEERTLAAEFEKLERELFLADEFIRTKVNLLEVRINKRFGMARFKLFNQLVNGGIEEVCETLYLGIPYSSALNNSARINIGLDIINTLSDHFQFVAPIWIDNAEAVTQLLPTIGQQITLYVSEPDKVLRIERAKEAVV